MYEEIKIKLQKVLTKRRYIHSLGVAAEGERLAALYGADSGKAYTAGLLHDCAKEIKNQAAMCDELGIEIDDIMRRNTGIIHGILGAEVARLDFGIDDEEILGAIRWHTIGKAKMTLLEKIIYIADFTEANRDFEGVDELRKAVDKDINEAIIISVQKQLARFAKKRQAIHPNTIHMWNDLIRS